MPKPISNSDNIIDSRDVIARIKELEATTETVEVCCPDCDGSGDVEQDRESYSDAQDRESYSAKCETCQGSGEVPNENAVDDDEIDELATLKSLQEDGEAYAPDWKYGATLIRDSYFKEYAQELADDIGAIDRNATWPLNCIDWDQAADELRSDYTTVDFDGVDYLIR